MSRVVRAPQRDPVRKCRHATASHFRKATRFAEDVKLTRAWDIAMEQRTCITRHGRRRRRQHSLAVCVTLPRPYQTDTYYQALPAIRYRHAALP